MIYNDTNDFEESYRKGKNFAMRCSNDGTEGLDKYCGGGGGGVVTVVE